MGQSRDVSSGVLAQGVNSVARLDLGLLAGRHEWLTVQENLNQWILLGVEAEGHLIEAWCHADDAALVLLPQEIVWASVDGLDFPWNLILVVEVTTLPDPTSNAVLSTEGLIYECLLIEGLLEVIFPDAPLNLSLN
jgi:hypothetical protein